ncbi:hypothetical protein [Shewanella indica]|uniref:hypothetical protein n=1 Tax=Shewanella indica TaxID=768528 RepID=UPI001CFE1B6A|nr:hypothetical protein [Shewanella indica]
MDALSTQQRYIIAINNELDVLDEDKSVIKNVIRHYAPQKHGYDVPLEEQKPFHSIIVSKLDLDREKLETYPMSRRHIFRVKGTNRCCSTGFVIGDELFSKAVDYW